MKASQFFISTLKEAPAEAVLASHKLMVCLFCKIYCLPAGQRQNHTMKTTLPTT